MSQTDLYLSDEFVSFSGNITALHAEKKLLQDELKNFYELQKERIRSVDEEASKLKSAWETYLSEHAKPE